MIIEEVGSKEGEEDRPGSGSLSVVDFYY